MTVIVTVVQGRATLLQGDVKTELDGELVLLDDSQGTVRVLHAHDGTLPALVVHDAAQDDSAPWRWSTASGDTLTVSGTQRASVKAP
jgi:hypothetical protein